MKFTEMSPIAQIGIFLVLGLVVTGLLYYFVDQPMVNANVALTAQITKQKAENDKLKVYENQMPMLERKLADLQQQLDIQKRIVPDEKEAPEFIHLMQDQAQAANVEIRRYLAVGTNPKEYYTEVPFTVEVDGPFYGVLNFFERIAKVERIINVSNLTMATVKKPSDAKVKKTYDYSPGESVVASCTVTTFFSHDLAAPAPAAGAKPAGAK